MTPRVRTVSGLPPARAPKRLVIPVDLTPLVQQQSNKIAMVDFGCCYTLPQNPPEFAMPPGYSAPEVLLQGARHSAGSPSDIWSLGCCISQISGGSTPLAEDPLDAVQNLEMLLGPLPEPLRNVWKNDFIDIISRYNGSVRNEAYIRDTWNQDPEPGSSLAPVSISIQDLAEKREEWRTSTGYADFLRYTLSRETIRSYKKLPLPPLSLFDESDDSSVSQSSAGSPGSLQATMERRRSQSVEQGENSPVEANQTEDDSTGEGNVPPADSNSNCRTDEDSLLRVISPPVVEKPKPLEPGEVREVRTEEGVLAWGIYRLSNEEVESMSDLLYQIFKYDPKERITAEAVLNHDWFRVVKAEAELEATRRNKTVSVDGQPNVRKHARKGDMKGGAAGRIRPCKWIRSSSTGRLHRLDQ